MAYYNDYRTFGNRVIATEDNGQSATYNDLADFSAQIGKALPKRTLVFSFCENNIGFMFGYLSFLENRIVPLLLDNHIHQDLAEQLMEAYRPAYVYAPVSRAEEFAGDACVFSGMGYGLYRTRYPEDVPLYDDLALLLTTSGSTGSPKLVRQSYENVQANAASIAQYLELDETERPITTLRMNYTYGLSIINSHVLVGAEMLLTNYTLWEKEFWDFFQEAGATSFGGVPYTYEMLKKLRFFRMKLPTLRTMTQAGGKLLPELHREFAEYEGPNVTLGYAETQEDLIKGDERHGRLVTGDMAKRDADGFYYIVGRKKRFLKIYGNRVNLDETERMVKNRFEGLECACTGVDDHMDVYVTEPSEEKRDEIRAYLEEQTRLHGKAFTVRFIEEIPKNEAGKTLYKELK